MLENQNKYKENSLWISSRVSNWLEGFRNGQELQRLDSKSRGPRGHGACRKDTVYQRILEVPPSAIRYVFDNNRLGFERLGMSWIQKEDPSPASLIREPQPEPYPWNIR